MISKKLQAAFNEQIVNELHASNSYIAMAAYMEGEDLKVLGQFFFRQSEEERGHALRLLKYLLDIGAQAKIGAIPEPNATFGSPREAVAAALEQEKTVTKQINQLMAIAEKDQDFAAMSYLKWFVDEQVEEVASMSELHGLLKRAGDAHLLLVEDRLLKQGLVSLTKPSSGPVQ